MAFAAAVADEEGHVLHNGSRGDLHLSRSRRANAPAIGWFMLVICVYVDVRICICMYMYVCMYIYICGDVSTYVYMYM